MSTSQQFFGSQNRNLSVRWASISCTDYCHSFSVLFVFGKIIISEINSFIGRTNLQPTCLRVPFVTLKLLLKNIWECMSNQSMMIVSSHVRNVRRPALEEGSWRLTWSRTEKLHANTAVHCENKIPYNSRSSHVTKCLMLGKYMMFFKYLILKVLL